MPFEYLLTIREKFTSDDDIVARPEAAARLLHLGVDPDEEGVEIKLQRLEPGKPPVGITL